MLSTNLSRSPSLSTYSEGANEIRGHESIILRHILLDRFKLKGLNDRITMIYKNPVFKIYQVSTLRRQYLNTHNKGSNIHHTYYSFFIYKLTHLQNSPAWVKSSSSAELYLQKNSRFRTIVVISNDHMNHHASRRVPRLRTALHKGSRKFFLNGSAINHQVQAFRLTSGLGGGGAILPR